MPDDKRPRIVRSTDDAAKRLREALQKAPIPVRYGDELTQAPPVALCGKWLYPGQLTTLTGEPGCGKSWIMARVEAAILMGDAFPGPTRAQQRSVLHVNRDDFVDKKWQALYEKLPGLHEVARDQLAMVEPTRAMPAEQVLPWFCQLADQIAEQRPLFRHDGALLMIDTLRTFFTGEENASEQMTDNLAAVREVVNASGPFPGAALCISHHTGWQQVGVEAHERGTSAFRGNVDEPLMVRNLLQERKRQADHNNWQRLRGYRVDALPPLATNDQIVTVTRMKGKLAELNPLSPGADTFLIEPVPVWHPTAGIIDSAWVVPCDLTAQQVEAISVERGRERRNEEDEAKVLAVLAERRITSKRELAKLTDLTEGRAFIALSALIHAGKVVEPSPRGTPYRVAGGDSMTFDS